MQTVSTCSLFISQDRENGRLGFPVKAIYCPLVYLSWYVAESWRKEMEKPIEPVCPLLWLCSVPEEGIHTHLQFASRHRHPIWVSSHQQGRWPPNFSFFFFTSKALNLVSRDMARRKAPWQKYKKSTHILMNMYSVSINKLTHFISRTATQASCLLRMLL